jgi:hypothetical protein
MPDWERRAACRLAGAGTFDAARASAPDARPVPGEEQPDEAAIEAEERLTSEIDVELQSDNPDPENVYNPATGSTHS